MHLFFTLFLTRQDVPMHLMLCNFDDNNNIDHQQVTLFLQNSKFTVLMKWRKSKYWITSVVFVLMTWFLFSSFVLISKTISKIQNFKIWWRHHFFIRTFLGSNCQFEWQHNFSNSHFQQKTFFSTNYISNTFLKAINHYDIVFG